MNTFEWNIQHLYGEKGKVWLRKLPKHITQIASVFGLHSLIPVSNLSYHYVLAGYQKDYPVMLKLGLDKEDLQNEARALLAFSGYGMTSLLAQGEGFLLLQRAIPGISLKNYFPQQDLKAQAIVCQLIKKIHQANIPLCPHLSHIKDWLSLIDQSLNIPTTYLQKARNLRDQLFATRSPDVLLHGDLHQDNILQNGHQWMMIDPKYVVGEPAYEVAAFVRNPIPGLLMQNNVMDILQERILTFARNLYIPASRIVNWCFVQAVLCWAWTLEDHGDVAYWEKITKVYDAIS